MASFTIELKQSAERDLRRIPSTHIENILNKIELLGANPLPQQARRLTNVEATYRLRVGEYRVIYQVDTKQAVILVIYIRHRREVYRRF
jgi:mRNA interferase RelE/StbE